jgi:hypothetical protein
VRIIAYDFEVFLKDWMVVLIDYETRQEKVIVNDRDELVRVYLKNKDSIWLGYNSRHYDQWIMKAILLGMNPSKVNDDLILFNVAGYRAVPNANQIPFNNFDISTGFHSLKQLEAFMGESVHETSVPFMIQRKLTDDEIQETIEYCRSDVLNTIKVFEHRKKEFDAQIELLEMFELPMEYISKTKAQLGAIILGAKKVARDDEFDLTVPDTLQLGRYEFVKDWFFSDDSKKEKAKLVFDCYGAEMVIGWGGSHLAKKNIVREGLLYAHDISSMYPATMIEWDTLSRNVADRDKFREIRDLRLDYKKQGDKLADVLKIAINSVFGSSGDKYNDLYDARNKRLTCMYGQLFMLDLLDKIENHFGDEVECLMVNTDGTLFQLKNENQLEEFEEIIREWESRSRYVMERDDVLSVVMKDVNNYVMKMNVNGKVKIKGKGSMVKFNHPLDNDLPIVNTAVRECLANGVPVEETINTCNELIQFQKIYKVTGNFKCAMHNGEELPHKVYRVFASKNENNSAFYKLKIGKETPDLFAGSPKHVFINNDNIQGLCVPDELDRQWYIDLANNRVNQFLKKK